MISNFDYKKSRFLLDVIAKMIIMPLIFSYREF